MPDATIDWASAEVSVQSGSLTLEVLLDSRPDRFWVNAFNEIRERQQIEMIEGVGKGWWWPDSPSGGRLTVRGIQPGRELEVRERLEEIVREANRAAIVARERARERRGQGGR
jgi:hypothetical protein